MRRAWSTESLEKNYSAGRIVTSAPTPYAHGSKYVPSDTHPPRQVPAVSKRLDRHLPLAFYQKRGRDRRLIEPHGS